MEKRRKRKEGPEIGEKADKAANEYTRVVDHNLSRKGFSYIFRG